jgi:hypothetical protein
MELKQRIAAFVQLGKFLSSFEKDAPWPGYDLGITASEYDVFNGLVKTVHLRMGKCPKRSKSGKMAFRLCIAGAIISKNRCIDFGWEYSFGRISRCTCRIDFRKQGAH